MFHLEEFWYTPYLEDSISEKKERIEFDEVILIWIHSEEHDKLDTTKVYRKTVKNIRWMVNKSNCKKVVLHSFVHLGESKADLDYTETLIENVSTRLKDSGLVVHIMPSGLNEFSMHVKGPSLSKVFKAF